MAQIGWGKPKIETCPSVNGKANNAWQEIDTPKQNTFNIDTELGAVTEAIEEGGNVVDSRTAANKYFVEWDQFVKKGKKLPFEDFNGIIEGEHALRVTPEDADNVGFLVERCTIRATKKFTSEEGTIVHYKAQILKPAEGQMLKEYYANALTLDKYKLYFGNAADSSGKVVTATSAGNVTAVKDANWITVSTSGKATTVKVTANDTGALRVGVVSITADGKTSHVEVTQIPS